MLLVAMRAFGLLSVKRLRGRVSASDLRAIPAQVRVP